MALEIQAQSKRRVERSDAHPTSRTSFGRVRSLSCSDLPTDYSERSSRAFNRGMEELGRGQEDFQDHEWDFSYQSIPDPDEFDLFDDEEDERVPLLDSQGRPNRLDSQGRADPVASASFDTRVPTQEGGVHGAQFTVPVNDYFAPQNPLLDPSGRPSPTTLVQLTDVTDENIRLQLSEVPRSKVVLYNAYGNNKGHYFDLKTKHHDKLQDIFYAVKTHCLASGEMPGDATGFTINWSKRVVRFYDPSIGHTRTLDLDKMMKASPEINDKVVEAEELISTKINKGDIRNHRIAPNNKGSFDGAAPLYRSNQVLNSLPKSTGNEAYKTAMALASNVLTDEPQKDAAIHRMGKAETIIKKTKDKVAQEKAALETSLSTERDPGRIAKLQKSRQELIALEQRLNGIDTFALYSALAFYPQDADPRPEDVYQRAQMLQKQSADMLQQAREQAIADGTQRSWIPKWAPLVNKLRKEPTIDESRFYPVDVGGIMFSGLEFPEARSGYVDFCRAHSVHCKGDGLEDALLREVLRPDSAERGDNPVLEHLFDDISDEDIRGRLETERDAAIQHVNTTAAPALVGTDPSLRIDDYRQKAALV
ncbi:MAG: hypothetical protein JSR39_02125 [Verrucomicrobia bacterium]|nr:hypothetical protein [Verrucomicrobiota bacterium]